MGDKKSNEFSEWNRDSLKAYLYYTDADFSYKELKF